MYFDSAQPRVLCVCDVSSIKIGVCVRATAQNAQGVAA